jgi:NTE family protein
LLVDGGPTSLVPVDACRSLVDLPIVAATVARGLRDIRAPKNAIDVVLRSRAISETHLAELALERADVVIRPHVESYGWADFAPLDELISRGRKGAKAALPEIARLLRKGKQPSSTGDRTTRRFSGRRGAPVPRRT